MFGQCSDSEGDPLALVGVGLSAQGATLEVTGSHILYLPGNDLDDTFSYTIADPHGAMTTGQITVNLVAPGGRAQAITSTGGTVTVHFTGIPGYRYDIERAEDAAFGVNRQVVQTVIAPRGPFRYVDASPPQPTAFYRLMSRPVP